jgi:hypothetical protein
MRKNFFASVYRFVGRISDPDLDSSTECVGYVTEHLSVMSPV